MTDTAAVSESGTRQEAAGLPARRRALLGLVQRKEAWRLSYRGWLLLVIVAAAGVLLVRYRLQPFLAVSEPVPCRFLVVEGWAPDYALERAAAEFKRGACDRIFCTGGPLEKGSLLSEYRTYADVAAAMLVKLGVPTNAVVSVPAGPRRQGRTWASALALRDTLRKQTGPVDGVNVLTVGAHARRTRLLFTRALGRTIPVGVVAVQPQDYNADAWWRSSYGLKDVLGEAVGYCGEVFDF